ncbi:hypothetical protein [uncultured Dubosiella sp.]|uniref:hypothetical protein n=1 Tax=uncultured Dubosiella sp. TaxID=1937011 RepID=UPI0025B4D664|nr:hypothetical protein [uncultured Dubosiella sp.]
MKERTRKRLLIVGLLAMGLAGCGASPSLEQPKAEEKETEKPTQEIIETKEEKEEAIPVQNWPVVTNDNGVDRFDVTLDEFYATVKSLFGEDQVIETARAPQPQKEGILFAKVDMSRIPHVTFKNGVTIYAFKTEEDYVTNVSVHGKFDQKDTVADMYTRLCQEIDPALNDPVAQLNASTNGCCGEVNVLDDAKSITMTTNEAENEISLSIRPFTQSADAWQQSIQEYCTVCSPAV